MYCFFSAKTLAETRTKKISDLILSPGLPVLFMSKQYHFHCSLGFFINATEKIK